MLLSTAVLLAAACAVPPVVLREAEAPGAGRAAGLANGAHAGQGPEAHAVLQVIPPGSQVQWGGAGRVLAVTGRGCETSFVDVEARRVTARIAACRVWPSPTRDVFLAHMADRSVVTWDGQGARGAMVDSLTDWSVHPSLAWSADGASVSLLPGQTEPRPDPRIDSPDGAWRASEDAMAAVPAIEVRDRATNRRVLRLAGMVDPRWSADGAFLSARSEGAKTARLVVLAAGRWDEVWRRPGLARGTWSTTGARLAVTAAATGLEVLDATTASTRPLPSATTAWFERLYPTPEGALMATLVPRESEAPQAVRIEPGGEASVVEVPTGRDPGWSADGSRRVVQTFEAPVIMSPSWRLYVDDPTTKEHAFVEHGYGGVDAQWSARAHRLLVVTGAPLLFDADTRRVWRVPVKYPSAAALDADGARAAMETPEGLQLVTLASKEVPVLLSARSDAPPVLLALARSRLAAVTQEGEVSVWNVEDRALVASWKAGFAPEHVAWIDGGRRLALSREEVLQVSDADGSHAVAVTAVEDGERTRLEEVR